MIYEYKPWAISKIKETTNPELDKRVNDLIKLRDQMVVALQFELDMIYDEIMGRNELIKQYEGKQ